MMQCNKFSPLVLHKVALALRENNNRQLDLRIQNKLLSVHKNVCPPPPT
jgi:hypothetical protein